MRIRTRPSIVSRLRGLVLALALLLAPLLGLTATPALAASGDCTTSGSTVTCTFTFTGAAQTWTVPTGVTQATFQLVGAPGGASDGISFPHAAGGKGATVTADLPLTAGSAVTVVVGGPGGTNGNGAGGFNGGGRGCNCIGNGVGIGGGGGGATDIRIGGTDLAQRVLVAGGGGGGGGYGDGLGPGHSGGPAGGAGGNADTDGSQGVSVSDAGAGQGGVRGSAGGQGGAGGTEGLIGDNGDPGGTGSPVLGGDFGEGGVFLNKGGNGGGGGGGYVGGGGGGGGGSNYPLSGDDVPAGGGGGGGGGSNFTGSSATNVTIATDTTGVPQVVITYQGALDTSAPAIAPSISGTLGNNGWYVSDVTVSWNVSDPDSAISSQSGCDPQSITSDTTGVTVTCTASSAGGTASKSVTIQLDKSAPSDVSGSAERAPDAGGYYNHPVQVSFSGTDAISKIADCTSTTYSGPDSNSASVSGSCTDNAGNATSASFSLNYDATKPTVSYSGNAGTYTVDQTITITCQASDNLSGIASSTCANISGPAYSFALGSTTRSATATDKAGNSGSGSTTFTVGVTFDSLCTLSANFSTDPAVDKGLCDKLASAKAAAAAGDTKTKNNNLNAYRQQVTAQSGKALTKQQATILTNLSKAL